MKNYFAPELIIAAFGICVILILQIIALFKGVDGMMFGTAMGAIGGIVGWVFKGYRIRK